MAPVFCRSRSSQVSPPEDHCLNIWALRMVRAAEWHVRLPALLVSSGSSTLNKLFSVPELHSLCDMQSFKWGRCSQDLLCKCPFRRDLHQPTCWYVDVMASQLHQTSFETILSVMNYHPTLVHSAFSDLYWDLSKALLPHQAFCPPHPPSPIPHPSPSTSGQGRSILPL